MTQLAQLVTGVVIFVMLGLVILHLLTGGGLTSIFIWLDTYLMWIIFALIGPIALGRFIARG
jgi:hypothetical protein